MATTYVLNMKAEFLKSRRTAAVWITVIGAAFIPAVNFLRLIYDRSKLDHAMDADPWGAIISDNWKISTGLLIPMFAMLITSLLVQIEYKNNTWKQVYASPRHNADIFFTKFLVINSMVLLCFALFNGSIILFSYAANLVERRYRFFSTPIPWKTLWTLMWKIYYGVLTIIVIQYWLSMRFKNFIVPLGIGLGLLIVGLTVAGWDNLYYYPYMYHAIFYYPPLQRQPGIVLKAEIADGLWFILILILSYRDYMLRKERG